MGLFISNESVQCDTDERFLSAIEVKFMKLGNWKPPASNYFHVNVLHSERKIIECHVRSEKRSVNLLNHIF